MWRLHNGHWASAEEIQNSWAVCPLTLCQTSSEFAELAPHWPLSESWHESQYQSEKYLLSHELLVKWHPIAVAVARLHSFLSFGNFPKFCYIEPKPPITLWSYKDPPIRDIAYCFIENNILPHHITYLVHSCWIDALLWIAILPSWVDKWGKPGEILYRFVPVSI